MKIFKTFLPWLVLLAAATAYGHGPGSDVHSFNWMVVDSGSTSMSSTDGVPDVNVLQRRFGDHFIYIREDDDGYVIRDRTMIDRAQSALKPVRDSKDAWGDRGEASRLHRKIAKSKRKIASADAEEGMDRAIKVAKREMRSIFEEAKSRHLAERVE